MGLILISGNSKFNDELSSKLKEYKYNTTSCSSLEKGKDSLANSRSELIIIDVDIIKKEDYGVLLDLKKIDKKISLVVMAKAPDKDQEILMLNRGADDFILQPWAQTGDEKKNFELLVARIETRLRFGGTNVIEIKNLIIDPDEEKIFFEGKEIELKGKPFEVLTHLAKHKDQIVSKEQLLDAIWEEPELVTPNVIEVAINQIRQKMDKPLGIGTIETVRRRGYRFCFPNCNKETNIVTA